MPSPIYHRVHDVQVTASRLILLYGLGRFAAAGILSAFGLGLIDYLLRLHDPAARWLLSASFVALVLGSFWKLFVPVLRAKQDVIGTARRIELRFPELGGRLSSAIAFMNETVDDPTAGSGALRRAVIAEAEAKAAGIEFRAALDRRAPRRALAVAGIIAALSALIAVITPSNAGLAVSRLVAPWRSLPWPRKHELVFVNAPSRLATGDDFEVLLRDRRNPFPDDLQVQIRRQTPGRATVETRRIKVLGRETVFRLENVTSEFEYRARGGDDDTMPWCEVTVVEPPNIRDLQVVVHPPSYSGLSPRAEGQMVLALIGSTLEVRGKLNQPIVAASLQPDSPAVSPPKLEVGEDGRSFHGPAGGTPWIVDRSGALELELTDRHGMKFRRSARIELHAVEDQPPSIAWEAPEEHVFVTAGAALPIKATIKDDLTIHQIQLRYLRARTSDEEEVIELYAGPETAVFDRRATLPKPTVASESETRQIHATWNLSRLAGLAPGDSLAVRITAEDYKPQLATTAVRRVTVITTEELESRIAGRQSAVLGQLTEALRVAQQCREQTKLLEDRIRTIGHSSVGDLSAMEAARFSLRQVQRLVGGGSEGAAHQISRLLDELAANRIDKDAAGQRLRALLKQVTSLEEQSLPAIDQELTEALKLAREADAGRTIDRPGCAATPTDEMMERLRRAGEQQEQVVLELERMTGALSQWDSFSRIAREVGQIHIDQGQLTNDTDDLQLKAVSGAADASPVDRTAGRQLSQRQLELARRLDRLQARMEEMLARLTGDDLLSAAALADALEVARRLAIGGQMREAAARLTQMQLSQARRSEQDALDALKTLIETLSLRRDYELARGLAGLRQAAGELRGLSERAGHVAMDAGRLARQPTEAQQNALNQLRRELEEIAKAGQQLAHRLQRLQAARAANSLGQAITASTAAAEAAGAGRTADLQSQAESARGRLEAANQDLNRAIAAAEEDLAREQVAQVGQIIAGLIVRQKNVISETRRLDERRDEGERTTTIQSSELKTVAADQRLLADETAQLKPQFAAAAVFSFAIEVAASNMQRAGEMLGRGETGAAVQDVERAGLLRLEQILAAFGSDAATPNNDATTGEQAGQQPRDENIGASTAEIKLVRLLQQTINERTAELEAMRVRSGDLSAGQQQELETLAREQGRLADMVLDWIKTTGQGAKGTEVK